MKIALCVNFYSPAIGGCESVVKRIAKHYTSEGHEVRIFTRTISLRKTKIIDGIEIESYFPGNATFFLSRIRKFAPNIVFIYSDVFDFFHECLTELDNIILAFCGGNKVIGSAISANMLKKNLNKVKALICHTKLEKDFIFAQKISAEKTHLIPIGVDLEEFDNNELTRNDLFKHNKEDLWVLNVANFFPGKGQNHLLKILEKVRLSVKRRITYIQVCSSNDFAICKQLETAWKHRSEGLSKINFETVLAKDKSREFVIGLFKNSNVFAFTSEKESFGLVLLESMTARLPWISTNVGVCQELAGGYCINAVKDSYNNTIFDNRTINIFAEKIGHFLLNSSVGEEGRKNIEENYQWKNILPRYSQLLT